MTRILHASTSLSLWYTRFFRFALYAHSGTRKILSLRVTPDRPAPDRLGTGHGTADAGASSGHNLVEKIDRSYWTNWGSSPCRAFFDSPRCTRAHRRCLILLLVRQFLPTLFYFIFDAVDRVGQLWRERIDHDGVAWLHLGFSCKA